MVQQDPVGGDGEHAAEQEPQDELESNGSAVATYAPAVARQHLFPQLCQGLAVFKGSDHHFLRARIDGASQQVNHVNQLVWRIGASLFLFCQ